MHENRQQALARRLERYRPLVDDWPALLETLERPLPLCVWTNRERVEVRGLEELLRAEGFEPRPLGWRPGAFRVERERGLGTRWWYLAGLAHCQEEASLLPVAVLDPRPGERVLDLCAAPGGKTTAIAERVGASGCVVAVDRNTRRLDLVRRAVRRLGLEGVRTAARDATRPLDEIAPEGGFDRILVDAPCSGLGTLRRNPDAKWRVRPGDPARLAELQRSLVDNAAAVLRPGGALVYSACTMLPEENEAIARHFARRSRDFRPIPRAAVPREVDAVVGSDGFLRTFPHTHDTDAFFAARFERRA